MPKWIKIAAYSIVGTVVILVVLGWLVLAAPFFSELRRSFVQDLLTQAIGQPLIIETDVRAIVAPTSHLTLSGVAIPSESIDDLNLAELKLMEFDLDLVSLLKGELNIDNIEIDGLHVNLVAREDGVTSWSLASQPAPEADGTASGSVDVENGIIAFFSDKNAAVSSVGLTVENHGNGFEFLFALESALLKQLDGGAGVSLSSSGTVNSYPLQIDGQFPTGAPFSTSADLGGMRLTFDGNKLPDDAGGGYAGDLVLDTGEIGDLLEVLKLERALEGTGQLTTRLVRQGTRLAVEDLGTVVNFRNGPAISLEGTVKDLFQFLDFDLKIDGQFFPEGQQPKRATELKDLKLVSVQAQLVSEGEALALKEILIRTNVFESDLGEIGPVSVGRVLRTQQDKLALEDIFAQLGPLDAPYVVATGQIEDLLNLKDLAFSGTLQAPANLLMDEFRNDVVQAFGGVKGEFEISDASGQLSLTKLEAHSENTELWTMKASASARSVTSVDDVDIELDLDVPDGAAFLEALQLKGVEIGPVGFFFSAEGVDKTVETKLSLSVGESQIDTGLSTFVDKEGRTTVRGSILSKLLNLHDLDKTGEAVVQLMKLSSDEAKGSALSPNGSADGTPKPEVQPLVLKDEQDAQMSEPPDAADDGRVVQPLVLADPEPGPEPDAAVKEPMTDQSGRTVQPLVLEDRPADGKPSDLLNVAKFGRDLDLEIGIEVDKVVGQAGVSSVSSVLTSKEGKADLGPLEFSYGGGYFKIAAAVDFVEKPQLARVFGATSGWDFGEILEEVGVDMKAYGKLRAQFDLTGNHKSARSFVNSMYGSVTVSMVNGKIASSLLDLAGLGVLPWLFSKELQQGYTDIVCFVAPMRIDAGKVSSNSIVVETKSVQLVAGGWIDWRKDQIALRAEPRPVGRPLARSAWPFEVTGRLSSPSFNIGGQRRNNAPKKDQSPQNNPPAQRQPCKPDIRQ